jgi:hypothetical protein
MNRKKLSRLFFLLVVLFPAIVYAQDPNVHYMIGKSQADVVKTYGAPLHKDDSNPDMICMFYQKTDSRMIFVLGSQGVYQAESYHSYGDMKKAQSELDKFVAESVSNGFTSKKISSTAYELHKEGINANVELHENQFSHKYEVSIKAHKSEES